MQVAWSWPYCSLSPLGITDLCEPPSALNVAPGKPVVVGMWPDGASVNIGQKNGMNYTLQSANPWLIWS